MTDPGAKKILLIDDEEDLVWSLVGRLTRALPDAAIEGSSAPLEAVQKLRTRHFDLIVTDLRMPEISGLDVLIEARKANPTIPVVVMTAYPTEQIRGEALRYGSVQYLEKPFNFSQLVTAIQDALYQPRGRGVSGAVSLETLPDLVQLFALSNITGALEITYLGQPGAIWFDRGAIIHSHTTIHSGEDAFFEIMRWRGGEFSMERNALPPERTIFENATGLIMEACRREDEEARELLEQGPPPISRSLFPTLVSAGGSVKAPPKDPAIEGSELDDMLDTLRTGKSAPPAVAKSPKAEQNQQDNTKGTADITEVVRMATLPSASEKAEKGEKVIEVGGPTTLGERARRLLQPEWAAVEALISEMGLLGLAVVVDLPTGAWTALSSTGPSTIVHESSATTGLAIDDEMHLRIAADARELARAASTLTMGEDGCMERISDDIGVAILWRKDLELAFLFGRELVDRAAITWFRSRVAAIARSTLRAS